MSDTAQKQKLEWLKKLKADLRKRARLKQLRPLVFKTSHERGLEKSLLSKSQRSFELSFSQRAVLLANNRALAKELEKQKMANGELLDQKTALETEILQLRMNLKPLDQFQRLEEENQRIRERLQMLFVQFKPCADIVADLLHSYESRPAQCTANTLPTHQNFPVPGKSGPPLASWAASGQLPKRPDAGENDIARMKNIFNMTPIREVSFNGSNDDCYEDVSADNCVFRNVNYERGSNGSRRQTHDGALNSNSEQHDVVEVFDDVTSSSNCSRRLTYVVSQSQQVSDLPTPAECMRRKLCSSTPLPVDSHDDALNGHSEQNEVVDVFDDVASPSYCSRRLTYVVSQSQQVSDLPTPVKCMRRSKLRRSSPLPMHSSELQKAGVEARKDVEATQCLPTDMEFTAVLMNPILQNTSVNAPELLDNRKRSQMSPDLTPVVLSPALPQGVTENCVVAALVAETKTGHVDEDQTLIVPLSSEFNIETHDLNNLRAEWKDAQTCVMKLTRLSNVPLTDISTQSKQRSTTQDNFNDPSGMNTETSIAAPEHTATEILKVSGLSEKSSCSPKGDQVPRMGHAKVLCKDIDKHFLKCRKQHPATNNATEHLAEKRSQTSPVPKSSVSEHDAYSQKSPIRCEADDEVQDVSNRRPVAALVAETQTEHVDADQTLIASLLSEVHTETRDLNNPRADRKYVQTCVVRLKRLSNMPLTNISPQSKQRSTTQDNFNDPAGMTTETSIAAPKHTATEILEVSGLSEKSSCSLKGDQVPLMAHAKFLCKDIGKQVLKCSKQHLATNNATEHQAVKRGHTSPVPEQIARKSSGAEIDAYGKKSPIRSEANEIQDISNRRPCRSRRPIHYKEQSLSKKMRRS